MPDPLRVAGAALYAAFVAWLVEVFYQAFKRRGRKKK
jgi:hypothetical protein